MIVIGLDGVRPDCLRKAHTPNIDSFIEHSRYTFNAISEKATISGPAWTTILTGVHMEKHRVFDNNFKNRDKRYKTVFALAKQECSWLKAAAFSHWLPIISKIFERRVLNEKAWGSDEKVCRKTVSSIYKGKSDILFVQLDDTDGAGHKFTYSPDSAEYLKAIEKADEYVGRIINAVRERPKDEEWLVICLTDHGGEAKGHGPAVPGCLNVFIIVSLPHFTQKLEINGQTTLADIVPTISQWLGLAKQEYWDGKSLI